jgi:hypothetical protein
MSHGYPETMLRHRLRERFRQGIRVQQPELPHDGFGLQAHRARVGTDVGATE